MGEDRESDAEPGEPEIDDRPFIAALIPSAAALWIGVSAIAHGALVVAFYYQPPKPESLSIEISSSDGRYLVDQMIEMQLEEEEEIPEWVQELEEPEDVTPAQAREQAREQAANVGAIGVLRAMTGSWSGPTSPYGSYYYFNDDPRIAFDPLMTDRIYLRCGYVCPGGTDCGDECTFGPAEPDPTRTADWCYYRAEPGGRERVPRIRSGNADIQGSLTRERIRRIFQRHLNEVRFCYAQALEHCPDLEGRVAVELVISSTGAVERAIAGRYSTLGNERVERCIGEAVRRWTFPPPEDGRAVVVTYPLVLSTN